MTGGVARGIRLAGPGGATRPLGDRVKQSLFGSLADRLEGVRVLDLFAGSGAAGIEALSRGAATCDFVDREEGAAAVIAENLRRTGLEARGRIHRSDVLGYVRRLSGEPSRPAEQRFGLVLLDPPYGDPVMLAALELLGAGDVLASEAIVVAKHFWRDTLPAEVGVLHLDRTRRFGETALSFYVAAGLG